MTHNVPALIDGMLVKEYAVLPSKVLPKGYVPPTNTTSTLEPIDLVVITVGEGVDGEPVYWVRCINDQHEVITGDMYYSLTTARCFLKEEYGVEDVQWKQLL